MALGKIKADTLEHSTAGSVDTQYVVNGSAKSHIRCELVGTAAIEGSLNIASLTDTATGKATPNFATTFSAATYSIASGGALNGDIIFTEHAANSVCVTGSFRIHTRTGDGNETLVDGDLLSAAIFGDLA